MKVSSTTPYVANMSPSQEFSQREKTIGNDVLYATSCWLVVTGAELILMKEVIPSVIGVALIGFAGLCVKSADYKLIDSLSCYSIIAGVASGVACQSCSNLLSIIGLPVTVYSTAYISKSRNITIPSSIDSV